MSIRFGRLPPLDARVEAPATLRAPVAADLAEEVAASLAARAGAKGVLLRRSGAEALRVALRATAARTGRNEAVLPALAGRPVAAAAVAAGLRVRLVDVDERGAIDPVALAMLPLERAACVVVASPFGVAEPIAPVAAVARPRGAWVIEDASWSFGAIASDGAAGTRGDLSVLGFGPGEALSGLGGGAVLWRDDSLRTVPPVPVRPAPRRAWLRARTRNLGLAPLVLATRAATGTRPFDLPFDADFPRGPIAGDALVACARALAGAEARRGRREAQALALAEALQARTAFVPLLPPPGTRGAFPLLAVRAPDRQRRDAALAALARHGCARPAARPLDALPELRERLAARPAIPGARALTARLLALPTHGGLSGRRGDEVVSVLARLATAPG